MTVFDKSADFSLEHAYAMPGPIMHLVAEGGRGDIARRDATILSQIKSHMAALGYTLVANPATADVNVLTSVNVRDYTGYAYYGGYWGYWYGYYPPAWGWYPYYPSGGVTYSYSVGTIFIMMTDPPRTTTDGKPAPPIWIAAVNGLADKSTNSKRIAKGIDQAFAQSLYLGEGK